MRNGWSGFEAPPRRAAGLVVGEQRRQVVADYGLRSVVEDLQGVFAVLWRGRRWIVAAMLAFALPTLAFLLLTPSQYRATAQIMLDPRPKKLVDGAVVPSGLGESSVGADTLLVDSQTEIITSPTVLEPVVKTEGLQQDDEFYEVRGMGMRMRLRNFVGAFVPGYKPEHMPAAEPAEVALDRFRDKHLEVKRVGNTYVINVSVRSTDAVKAARLANAVAQSYIREQVAFLNDTTRGATAALQSRIVELRGRVIAADDKVEAFRRSHGLHGGPGMLSTEQQLQDLNGRLSAARAETGLAKARYERLRSDTPEQVAAGDTNEALNNKVIVNLRALLAQAERRLSGLKTELGPAHPDLIRAREERRGILNQIEYELARVRAVAKNEYELSQANEKSLSDELNTARTRLSENKSALVRLRELEREAEAAKSVLESFLVRAKQTSEQESLSRPSSRIIATAVVPSAPSFPPTKLLAAAALFFGIVTGALLVWLRHIMTAPEPRVAELPPRFVATIDEEGRLLEGAGEIPAGDETLPDETVEAFQARLEALQRSAWSHPHQGPNRQT